MSTNTDTNTDMIRFVGALDNDFVFLLFIWLMLLLLILFFSFFLFLPTGLEARMTTASKPLVNSVTGSITDTIDWLIDFGFVFLPTGSEARMINDYTGLATSENAVARVHHSATTGELVTMTYNS